MLEVVLDTNVLVTALRSRRGASFQLIRLIGEGAFLPNVSVALALEYEEVLKRPDIVPGLTGADIDGFLDFIFQSSILVPSVLLNRPVLSDPDDERFWTLRSSVARQSLRTIKETSLKLGSEASPY